MEVDKREHFERILGLAVLFRTDNTISCFVRKMARSVPATKKRALTLSMLVVLQKKFEIDYLRVM